MLMACDQSVRGFAYAAAPSWWDGDWSLVRTGRFDGGTLARTAPEIAHRFRQERIFEFVDQAIAAADPNLVGFESYAFSARPDVDVVELTGMLKKHLWGLQKATVTVNQSTARKLLLGKVPRKGSDAKDAVRSVLMAAGAPERFWSLDHTDALCVLNAMISDFGGYSFAQN